jgi:hypothetical protein
VLFSCRTVKPVVDPSFTPNIVEPSVDEVVIADTTRPSAEVVIPVIEDSVNISPAKRSYKIAVLLPFSINSYQPEFQDAATANFKRSTEIALEFYQGFEWAMTSMEQSAIDAEIFVYDTRNDPVKLRSILNSASFGEADLIIGPIFNDNLRITAEYCKKNKIPMISPLSSSTDITSRNPYYYSANGTADAHYEALARHIKAFYPSDTVHIIHNSTNKSKEVIRTLKQINRTILQEDPIYYEEIPMTTESNTFDLRSEFDSLSTHVVLIPSYDEVFTNYALNQLAQIKTYYPSVVFGMPTWSKFKNVNYDYLEWLQVHLTQSYHLEEQNTDIIEMTRQFDERFQMQPSAYAFQGYDLAHLVVSYLASRSGLNIRDKEMFFALDTPLEGLQTGFQFLPVYSKGTDEIDFWDNKYMHILKFADYTFNKVP